MFVYEKLTSAKYNYLIHCVNKSALFILNNDRHVVACLTRKSAA